MFFSKSFRTVAILVVLALLGLTPNKVGAQGQPTAPRQVGSGQGEAPRPPPPSPKPAAPKPPPPAKPAPPKSATTGPFSDGLWHMTFESEVDKLGCITITDEQLCEDNQPLYTCRSPDDNRFHVIRGSQFGADAWIVVHDLKSEKGVVSYKGKDDKGDWYSVTGETKTALDGRWSAGGGGFSGGIGAADPPSMSSLPVRDACGVKTSEYIFAKGDPLVKLFDPKTRKPFVCWGKEESPRYEEVYWLDFITNHVRYFGVTDDGLTHIVQDRRVGKGYEEVQDVAYDGDHVTYRARDKKGWHIVRDIVEEQPFEEMGTLFYIYPTGKLVYAARRSPPH